MAKRWPAKDPEEILDYALDWTPRLGGDTVAQSQWIVPTGLTKDSEFAVADHDHHLAFRRHAQQDL